jgi:opacity protein-like surface antigen
MILMKHTTVCAFSLFLCASLAHANTEGWNEHTGFFVEGNVGGNAYLTAIAVNDDTFSHAGVHGMGWSAALGYKFTEGFGLEAGFMQNYAEFDLEEDDDDDDDDRFNDDDDEENVSGNTNIPYAAMRFAFPIGDQFAILAKLGAMHVSIDTEDDEEADDVDDAYIVLPYTGVGVSYAITPEVELLLQYQGAIYGIVNAGLLSGGVAYNF